MERTGPEFRKVEGPVDEDEGWRVELPDRRSVVLRPISDSGSSPRSCRRRYIADIPLHPGEGSYGRGRQGRRRENYSRNRRVLEDPRGADRHETGFLL